MRADMRVIRHYHDFPNIYNISFCDVPLRRQNGATMKAAKDPHTRTERINVRLPDEMLAAIDAECTRRTGKVSRNTWILEAVQERLTRTGGSSDQQSNAERETNG